MGRPMRTDADEKDRERRIKTDEVVVLGVANGTGLDTPQP